jgi:hypothetical protein
MSIYLLVPQLLLVILWIYCLYAVLNPKKIVAFTVDRYLQSMGFYCFKASIKPTKKSVNRIRNGHLAVLILVTVYILLIFVFGKEFLHRLFY